MSKLQNLQQVQQQQKWVALKRDRLKSQPLPFELEHVLHARLGSDGRDDVQVEVDVARHAPVEHRRQRRIHVAEHVDAVEKAVHAGERLPPVEIEEVCPVGVAPGARTTAYVARAHASRTGPVGAASTAAIASARASGSFFARRRS